MELTVDQVASYIAEFDFWSLRDGQEWLAWCPAIDVITQARTKKQALESLREAVELWFESCIERNVLAKALHEVQQDSYSELNSRFRPIL